jgi:hypothetical protein
MAGFEPSNIEKMVKCCTKCAASAGQSNDTFCIFHMAASVAVIEPANLGSLVNYSTNCDLTACQCYEAFLAFLLNATSGWIRNFQLRTISELFSQL